jgi:hydrogenase nickel incorporation protein HypA/HybF
MHELGITRNIVAIVEERAAGRRVLRVKLELGRLSGFAPEALQFCFDLCAQGTTVQGARLDIVDIDGLGRCSACGAQHRLEFPLGRCPSCHAPTLAIVAGEELKIREMEVQ